MENKVIDVGIITIIPTEIEALFTTLNIEKDKEVETNSPFTYWRTEFYSHQSQRSISIVVSYITGDAGNTETAICVSHFLRDWHPRLMCLVGIAAGIRGKTKIGDVVIPNRIHDRTIKVFRDGSFMVRGFSSTRPDNLERMIKIRPLSTQEFRLDCEQFVKEDIDKALFLAKARGLGRAEFNGELQLQDGSLSSDNVLIRDEKYFKGILNETDERCRGGDMESAGFVRACQIEDSDFPWLIFRGISDFGDNKKDDCFQLLAARSASIALRMFLEKCINIDHLPVNPRALATGISLEFDLLDQVRGAYKANRWLEVCRVGHVISRHLWLSGQYELRIEVGKLVEESASYGDDQLTRARTLIDDLGWTSFTTGNALQAKKYIIDGIRIAKEIDDYYSIAKGKRHLASIARQNNDLDGALNLLSEAKQDTKSISDNDEKIELSSSLLISESKILIAQKKVAEAISKLKEALTIFKNNKDKDREAKVYALLGDAYLLNHKKADAIHFFYDGRRVAFSIGRFDEVSNNTTKLIRNLANKHQQEKINMAEEVLNLAKAKGLLAEARKWKTIMEISENPNRKAG